MAAPISSLLSSKLPFAWGDAQQHAFGLLKEKLTSAPVLKLPEYSKPFTLTTDASKVATGGELSQDGRPVAYHSKKFSPAEARYNVTDQEMLAVYQAAMKWR